MSFPLKRVAANLAGIIAIFFMATRLLIIYY